MWSWEQHHPGTSTMHIAGGPTLHGPLDLEALARAVDRELARHDALRLRIELAAGTPVQHFAAPRHNVLERNAFGTGSLAERRAAAHAFVHAEAAQPIALAGDRLIRVLVLAIAADEHVLVVLAHRIAFDPTQLAVLFGGVLATYDALVRGAEPADDAPALQYADFTAWQGAVRDHPAFAARLAAYRARLAGAAPLALPYDRPIPAPRAPDIHLASIAIPPGLDAFARAEGATALGVLLAAFHAFLALETGQADVVVTLPFTGAKKLSRAIGATFGRFGDYVVVRTPVDTDGTARDAIAAARSTMRTAYDDAEIPAAWVLDDDNVCDHPLARAVLNVVTGDGAELTGHGLRVEWDSVPRPAWQRSSDLAWWVVQRTGLSLLAGAADVFDADTITRFAQQMTELLAGMVATPTAPLRALAPAAPAVRPAVAPTTPTELALARIWCEGLGIGCVGIHDDFLELGGQSILALQLVARIAHELGVELSPRALFERPTIAALAATIDHAGPAVDDDAPARGAIAALVASLSDAEVAARLAAWSPPAVADGRRVLADHLLAEHDIDRRASQPLLARASSSAPASLSQRIAWDFHLRGNCPEIGNLASAFAITGPLDVAALGRAVAALIVRQTALCTVFAITDGQLVQTVRDAGPTLELVDLSACPRDERWAMARARFEAIARPHDLATAAFRVALVTLDDREHVLLVAPHHIVCDGFSMRVLLGDLAALYAAELAGVPPALPALAFRYTDFCAWQSSLGERPTGAAQLAFWARTVAGYRGLELPGDRGDRVAPARGAVGLALDTYASEVTPFALDETPWRAVERACLRLHTTPYVILATAYFLLLTGWSGEADACVLTGNFHRSRRGSEALIGDFHTTYPLRVQIDEGGSVDDAVRAVDRAVAAHRAHADVAPESARASWPEWSRYNFNFLVEAPETGARLGEAAVERLGWAVSGPRPNDLALIVRQRAHSARGVLSFNAERFSPALAARIAARLVALIAAVCARPADPIAALVRVP